jgi:hypothetical protein
VVIGTCTSMCASVNPAFLSISQVQFSFDILLSCLLDRPSSQLRRPNLPRQLTMSVSTPKLHLAISKLNTPLNPDKMPASNRTNAWNPSSATPFFVSYESVKVPNSTLTTQMQLQRNLAFGIRRISKSTRLCTSIRNGRTGRLSIRVSSGLGRKRMR